MTGRLIMRCHYLNRVERIGLSTRWRQSISNKEAVVKRHSGHGYEGHSLYFYSFIHLPTLKTPLTLTQDVLCELPF